MTSIIDGKPRLRWTRNEGRDIAALSQATHLALTMAWALAADDAVTDIEREAARHAGDELRALHMALHRAMCGGAHTVDGGDPRCPGAKRADEAEAGLRGRNAHVRNLESQVAAMAEALADLGRRWCALGRHVVADDAMADPDGDDACRECAAESLRDGGA